MTLINAPEMAFVNIQKILATLQDDCAEALDPIRAKALKQSLKEYSQLMNSMEFSVEEEYKKRTVKHSYVLKFDAPSELIIALKHTMVCFIDGNLDVNTTTDHLVYEPDFLSHVEALKSVIEMHELSLPYAIEVIESTLDNLH